MAKTTPPKAILFDIGGVVVVSPFQAILDYEIASGIPTGWINFSIQKGPHDTGAWQQIERGECALDDAWFASFKRQLSNPAHWEEFLETKVQRNPESNPGGGAAIPDDDTRTQGEGLPGRKPKVPEIDAKALFWNMMRISRTPDPFMYPALKALRKSGKFVLGALSNTVVFPEGIKDEKGVVFTKNLVHPPAPSNFANDSTEIQGLFDVFVSSAHVGVRKPDPRAYELAVREMDKAAREKGDKSGVKAEEVLFLDDIGVNLKWAKKSGLRTIKVDLGKTREAVKELEKQTGLNLLGDKAKL
ncbi:HAD-like protein [Delitschia confertaspora ATCC 74209]|uniref:HAD-like protein n=1 Tax=Delitschia confertaspora ATCC 74209 TaxID=1513339 RepID=A0A9P4MQX9_9PLEO|nr:HAD-like protein [Delitschia confertaspora ATCC 74209]